MEHSTSSWSFYPVPGYVPSAFQRRPEDQDLVEGSSVRMSHEHYDSTLPLTPPDHGSIVPDAVWCEPYFSDYLVPAMMIPPPLFYDLAEPSSLAMIDGRVAFTPPLSPSSLISNEFLVATEATATALLSSSSLNQLQLSSDALPVPARYKCETCNKRFTRPYNLKSHLRTHTNERPFACLAKGCSWKFARPHDLKRHGLLHSGKKPHKCSVCNKQFARRDALRRHWKVERECGDVIEGLAATSR